jgi:hypothetical protein
VHCWRSTIFNSNRSRAPRSDPVDSRKLGYRFELYLDATEFHKAIGLAAHGVGIGSYVYLRRIFERLIKGRFDEFKETEKWSEEDFLKVRMHERIELLKEHLPEFLVRNKKVYSILSLGVHELDEKVCLEFFPVLRSSIVVILEEDKRKLEELRRQQDLEKAISKFKPS